MNSKFFVLLTLFITTECCGDYYWRDYEQIIPADAIPAGNTTHGTAYIAQAYIHEYGVLLGTIIPGVREVHVPCYGVKTTSVILKILCAQDKRKYFWLKTSRDNYANDIKDKCPVLGGFDQREFKNSRLGTLHVGKTYQEGNTIIGNIAAYDGSYPFYYPLHNQERQTSDYEVLVYTGFALNPFEV